jgi:hypothetical protein
MPANWKNSEPEKSTRPNARHSERSEESPCIGTAFKIEIDSLYIIACGNDNVHDDAIHPRVYTAGLKKSIIDLP